MKSAPRSVSGRTDLQALNPVSRRSDFFFEAAVANWMAVVAHTGSGVPFSLPSLVIAAARRYPELPIVLGHAGSPLFMLECAVAADVCPNIYVKVSSLKLISLVPAGRLMAGSDLPESVETELGKGFTVEMREERLREILWDAGAKLFGRLPVKKCKGSNIPVTEFVDWFMERTGMRESRGFVQEMKFLITPECAEAIRQWARTNMAPDPHAGGVDGDEYRVTSLYLDTPDLAVYERRGSYGRSKYRVRRYGETEVTFLERKLKTRNRVGKLRSIVGLQEIPELGQPEPSKCWAGRWFHRRLQARGLQPVCQISYRRTARLGVSESGPIRLTVDHDLLAVAITAYAFADESSARQLSPGRCILELKYRGEIPGLFKELMQRFDLVPQASSKYRMAIEALQLHKETLCLAS